MLTRLRPLLLALLLAPAAGPALAQQAAPAPAPPATQVQPAAQAPPASLLPSLPIGRGEDFELPVQLILLLTVLSLAPAIVILMTSFTRLVVVFGILRTAIGLQQAPPTQVLVGLALFLSLFIMYPVLDRVNERALKPYLAGTVTQEAALAEATAPMKAFMLAQTREKDLLLFMDLANTPTLSSADAVPLHVLVPAFVISELRVAFQIGFMLFLPFLIVDLLVSSVLMSMGMMMLPPVMISLPVKLLLFVLTDGWYLLVESMVRGYTLPAL